MTPWPWRLSARGYGEPRRPVGVWPHLAMATPAPCRAVTTSKELLIFDSLHFESFGMFPLAAAPVCGGGAPSPLQGEGETPWGSEASGGHAGPTVPLIIILLCTKITFVLKPIRIKLLRTISR